MKDIVRFMRFLAAEGCLIEKGDAVPPGKIALCRKSGERQVFDLAIAAEAQSRGLAERQADTMRATPEARAFLRRFLAAREEAFLDQHRVIEIETLVEPEGARMVRVNAAESPLSQLARLRDKSGQGWFSGDAISAGERLARDFQYASLQPRITPRYGPHLGKQKSAGPGGATEMSDNVLAARNRVSKAVDALGPELSGIALDVCCFEKGLEAVERERQWPARSAKLMLKTALLRLHRHYHPDMSRRRSHAWGEEGLRPDWC